MNIVLYDTACKYVNSGVCALPAYKDRKYPTVNWKRYQTDSPTINELTEMFSNDGDAVCIVCGKVSGGVESLDFDQHGKAYDEWKKKVISLGGAETLKKLTIEQTPSGGYHATYRCSEVEGNQKLAMTRNVENDSYEVLIETRGQDGLILCAPTRQYNLLQGDYTNLQTITPEERRILFQAAISFNEPKVSKNLDSVFGLPIEKPVSYNQYDSTQEKQEKPGDDFNTRGDVRGLLEKHGWKFLRNNGYEEHWTRPGKEFGTSGTLKLIDDKLWFYVFSTNAGELEPRAYDPFGLYTYLEADGDFRKATQMLAETGYGKKESIPEFNIDWNSKQKKQEEQNDSDISSILEDDERKLNIRDPETFIPFPIEKLPFKTQRYIVELAASLRQDPSAVAMAVLAQAGAHIGPAVIARPANSWDVAPILWVAYIGLSGAGKTPVFTVPMNLTDRSEKYFEQIYNDAMEDYKREYQEFVASKDKDAKSPIKPDQRHVFMTQSTYENFIDIAKASGCRTLYFADELSSFFANINKSKVLGESGKWLGGYNGGKVKIGSRASGCRSISRAYWSVTGGATPDMFRNLLKEQGAVENGTLSRFSLIWPPQIQEYSRSDISQNAIDEFQLILESLIFYQPTFNGQQVDQLVVNFSEQANEKWLEWDRSTFIEGRQTSNDTESSLLSKIVDMPVRIAIILHCLWAAESFVAIQSYDSNNQMDLSATISGSEMEAGIAIANWIFDETSFCYRNLSLVVNTDKKDMLHVYNAIKNQGEKGATENDIMRSKGCRKFRSKKEKNNLYKILKSLEKGNMIIVSTCTNQFNKKTFSRYFCNKK